MEHHRNKKIRIVFTLIFGLLLVSAFIEWDGAAQTPQPQLQPNHAFENANYVGSHKCIQCHSDKVHQPTTPMGRAAETAADCQVLRSHPLLTFRSGPFSYKIERKGDQSIYSVTDGKETFSAPILYGFGQGKFGQTYIFEHNGAFYESRVSFYNAIKGLDITIGAYFDSPKTLEQAAGNRMNASDARNCFGCHSTAAATKSDLKIEKLITGITCESCHGPGEKHIAAMGSGKFAEKHIYNPSGLETEEMSNFCGSCHRTWEQVVLIQQAMRRNGQEMGINSVRFQPYRIANSKCYDMSDKRISCTACHDPHRELETDPGFYDSKCTACHTSDEKLSQVGNRVAKLCPTGKQKCVTCHMPSTKLPGSHTTFNDHLIRVVRPGESVW